MILDLLGLIIIIIGTIFKKITLTGSLINNIHQIANANLSGVCSFAFIFYYIIIHGFRYHNDPTFDQSGMYNIKEYEDGSLKREYDRYLTKTGYIYSTQYLVFHILLSLFSNTVLGFLITYATIIIKDSIAYYSKKTSTTSIHGTNFNTLIVIILYIICVYQYFESDFMGTLLLLFYYVFPTIGLICYLSYCAALCNEYYGSINGYSFYLIITYIVGIVGVIILLGFNYRCTPLLR